jgi:hypothetical protein
MLDKKLTMNDVKILNLRGKVYFPDVLLNYFTFIFLNILWDCISYIFIKLKIYKSQEMKQNKITFLAL